VTYPKGYLFEISPWISSELKLVSESKEQKLFKLEGGILPKQGFVFYLKNVNDEPNNSNSDDTKGRTAD
jgi:hypothetical protein